MRRLQDAIELSASLAKEPRLLASLPQWLRDSTSPLGDPRVPWWPAGVADVVSEGLPKGAEVFEFGGGGSTHWLIAQGAKVTTVENDVAWFTRINSDLQARARIILCEARTAGNIRSQVDGRYYDAYVAAIDSFDDDSFDLVIVDGRARLECCQAAFPKVKPGGRLLLDDSQRPRYSAAAELFAGWQRVDVRGLKRRETAVVQTSIWTKPGQ